MVPLGFWKNQNNLAVVGGLQDYIWGCLGNHTVPGIKVSLTAYKAYAIAQELFPQSYFKSNPINAAPSLTLSKMVNAINMLRQTRVSWPISLEKAEHTDLMLGFRSNETSDTSKESGGCCVSHESGSNLRQLLSSLEAAGHSSTSLSCRHLICKSILSFQHNTEGINKIMV